MRLGLLPLGRRPVRKEVAAYLSAPLPSARTPWREAAWCAVDLELTGLDPRAHEIISFGAVPIDAGRVRVRGAVSALVRPAGEISVATIPVHGLRTADLEQEPALSKAIGPLLEAITGHILVVHTAAVERAFLGRALRDERARLRGPIVDTQVLGCAWLHIRDGVLRRHMALGELADELGLPADHPHDALSDALTTAQVFVALASHLDATHSATVGTLLQAERRVESLRIFNTG